MGIEKPSAEEHTFRNVYLPGWLEKKGMPGTASNVMAAFEDYKRVQPFIPGRDIVLPPEVEAQRLKIAQELADARAAAAAAAAGAKPPTEGERKTFGFYERMQNAAQLTDSFADQLSKMNWLDQLRLKKAPNFAQTETGQLYWQALRQFTEARLRRESGAVISPSEFEYSEKTFFPQPGDTPATLKRKKDARDLLVQSMARESGRAYTQSYGEPPPRPAGPPQKPNAAPAQEIIEWERGPDGKLRKKK